MSYEPGYEYIAYHQGMCNAIDLPYDLTVIVVTYAAVAKDEFLTNVCSRITESHWFDSNHVPIVAKIVRRHNNNYVRLGHYRETVFQMEAEFYLHYDLSQNYKLTTRLHSKGLGFDEQRVSELDDHLLSMHYDAAKRIYFDKPTEPTCCQS
jgi:hypothetical protein